MAPAIKGNGKNPLMQNMRKIILMSALIALSGCGTPLWPSTTPGYVPAALVVDGVTIMVTDKTVGDHIASIRSGKDCSTVRKERGQTYCVEDEDAAQTKFQGYCYNTLGTVTCYTEPDPRRAEHTLVEYP